MDKYFYTFINVFAILLTILSSLHKLLLHFKAKTLVINLPVSYAGKCRCHAFTFPLIILFGFSAYFCANKAFDT